MGQVEERGQGKSVRGAASRLDVQPQPIVAVAPDRRQHGFVFPTLRKPRRMGHPHLLRCLQKTGRQGWASRPGNSNAVPCSRPHPRWNTNWELTLGLVQRTGALQRDSQLPLLRWRWPRLAHLLRCRQCARWFASAKKHEYLRIRWD